jgi:nucleoside-diphosphate-sugar epimerase
LTVPIEILLIGGSGFMGRQIARTLLTAGHRVTVLSRGRRDAPMGVTTLLADRDDPVSLAAALENRRFDLTVDFLVYDAADLERLLLVPYAALGRYFMISSGQVYLVTEGGEPPYQEEDAERPVRPEPTPGTRDHDNWTYGLGKRRAEKVLLALRSTHGVRGVALRLPIVQGEADDSLRLWAYLERMLDGAPLVLPDGGVRLTRFLPAADLARALARLVESPAPRNAVYNLAQPEVVPLRDFLERVAHAAKLKPRFVDASWDECRAVGLNEDFSPYAGDWVSVLDPSRAAAEWGFLGTRLDEYLPDVVRWHLEHRPPRSHPGYAQRAHERELATRLAGAAR